MDEIAFLQTYQKIQQEVLDLTYSIAFDDAQIKTSSIYIADLVLRIASEIESVAKTICRESGRHTDRHRHFDSDCIESIPDIENTFGVIIAPSMHFVRSDSRVYFPFRKTDVKPDGTTPIFPWNNAYQSLKHDKLASIKEFATIEYLLSAFSALTILLHLAMVLTSSDIVALPDSNGMFWRPGHNNICVPLDKALKTYIQNNNGQNIY